MTSYQDQAITKIKAAKGAIKGQKERVVAPAVADALTDFCRQDEEFAQAVAQGGSFADCLDAVVKGVGSSISDLDAYRRAVQFYFPGADIKMQMSIDLCPQAGRPEEPAVPDKGGIVLDFKSLFF